MRVILSAFQGKLRSEVMDYPENTSPKIDMVMDMETPHTFWSKEEDLSKPTVKRATFEWQGKEYYDDKPGGIREYILIDVF